MHHFAFKSIYESKSGTPSLAMTLDLFFTGPPGDA